jgi:DNA-binding HxlR family transcriptional regulator
MDVPCGLRVTTGKVGRRRGEDKSEEARVGISKPPDGFRGRWEMNTTGRAKAIPPIFVGKWTTNILFALNERAYRHGQLKRRLRGVSQRMLTRTLRNLESARLLERESSEPDGRVVRYSLTELGRGFIRPLTGMCDWARQHDKNVSAEVRIVEMKQP